MSPLMRIRVRARGVADAPGLARIAFAAPAMAPAAAISLRDSCGKGDIIRFDTPYAAKSSEFTPAMPISGLAMPAYASSFVYGTSLVALTFVQREEALFPNR